MSTVHQPAPARQHAAPAPADLEAMPLRALCRHVELRYHRSLRRELPQLSGLIARVERLHSIDDHRLDEARNVFERLRAELEAHMVKEERLVFPLCLDLELGRRMLPLQAALTMLEREHAEALAALARLRQLTDGFAVEGVRCDAHRRLMLGLAALADETTAHLEVEQRLLFPRALALAGR